MSELAATAVVHFFDTGKHRILCGVRGADHRSTKHARTVTCQACVGLLAERPAQGTGAALPAPGQAS
jgi:hypothetical protein